MKTAFRILSLVLCVAAVLGLFGCAFVPDETTQTTTAPENNENTETTGPADTQNDAILTARRDAAEAYMRAMATYLWRAEEDITYTLNSNVLTDADISTYTGSDVIRIRKGGLYRGIPYSFADAPAVNFMDYCSEADEKGVHTLSGLHWRALSGEYHIGSRAGNDCSSAIQLAWNYIGANVTKATTQNMTRKNGYLPVGEYVSSSNKNSRTTQVCIDNGQQTMYAAYAQLQKADAVVYYATSWGHSMMVVDVNVVYNADGTINGAKSTATFLQQTRKYIANEIRTYDRTLGETVYMTFGIDDKFTFRQLFDEGYLPVTCQALIDPAAAEDPWVKDTENVHTRDNILSGVFTSNRVISSVEITITDASGNVVAQAACYNPYKSGQSTFIFSLQERFSTELDQVRWGELELEKLTPGSYHCTHILRDAHGEKYTMRDFDFTV